MEQGYQKARKIVEDNEAAIERVAMALLEREVLDSVEVRTLVDGKELPAFQSLKPPSAPSDGASQQVLKPEPPRRVPGMLEGGPQPA